jgi:hypothetical protein
MGARGSSARLSISALPDACSGVAYSSAEWLVLPRLTITSAPRNEA